MVDRRSLLRKAGAVALAGATAGCNALNEKKNPDLTVESVSKELNERDLIVANIRIRNDSDELEEVTPTLKVERDGTLVGEKRQLLTIIPRETWGFKAEFQNNHSGDGVTINDYTVSGTIPGHDWVTADEG